MGGAIHDLASFRKLRNDLHKRVVAATGKQSELQRVERLLRVQFARLVSTATPKETHRNVEHRTLSSAHAHVESYLTRRSWKERWALLEPMPQLWKNSSNKPGGTTVRDSFTDTTADSRSRELLRLDFPRRRDCDRWLCLRSTPGKRNGEVRCSAAGRSVYDCEQRR